MVKHTEKLADMLRASLAAAGYGPKDVRVTHDALRLSTALDVTICRLGIRVADIDRIAKEHTETLSDERGEFLGWNRHVDVRYSATALAPLRTEALQRIAGMPIGLVKEVGGCIVEHIDNAYPWVVSIKRLPDFTPRAYGTARRAATFVAQVVASNGGKRIP
jgi:hypothetical protein